MEADYALNHSHREYKLPYVKKVMEGWKEAGGAMYYADKVIFTLREQTPSILEFHSINGGDARDLTAAVNRMLTAVRPYYYIAATYYDNPRVSALLKHSKFTVTCGCINGGEDRTYEAKFDLRS